MPDISPLIRLFVSSTFADFTIERDVLQRMVFPRLRQLCEAQGCRFQPIDLRWGVSEEAGNEKRTLTICFEEIRRCQQLSPDLNFLILLGDRYGSCFLPANIPSAQVAKLLPHLNSEDQNIFRDAYREDLNALRPEHVLLPNTTGGRNDEQLRMALGRAARAAGFSPEELLPFVASATHLEIQRGLLAAGADPAAVVCALRSFTPTPSTNDTRNDTRGYLEQESARNAEVESLKHAVEERLEGRLQRYTVPWDANGPALDREALAQQLRDLIEPRVREALARRQAAAQARDPVREANAQFAAARTSVLVGREDALATVAAYLSNQLPLPLVVTGISGVGKSTVLARAVEDATRMHPQAVVVTRYIGVTPGTGNLFDLLFNLHNEIAQRYGLPAPEPLSELSQVMEAVAKQLGTLKISAGRPLFLFIDALDQLGDQRQRLDWLPRTLAPNVRLVLSILPDRPELANLRTWMPEGQVLPLDPLTRMQGAEVLHAWLSNEGRQLTHNQGAAVLDGFAPAPQERGTPLYLRLAFDQAHSWRSFDAVDPLPPTVQALIQAYFEELEKPGRHGQDLVAFALGDVAAAKHGLAEDELLDILPRSSTVRDALRLLNPDAPPIDDRQPLPVVLWARLHADLDRYLTERGVDGTQLVTFYHRQILEEAARRYLAGTDRAARHADLAAYFGAQAYYLDGSGIRAWNRRKLAELAYQQAEEGAEGHRALKTTLTDGRFLEGKLTVAGVSATLDDVSLAPHDEDIQKIAATLRAGAIVLTKDPGELPNQLVGRVGGVPSLHDLPESETPRLRLRFQSLVPLDPAQMHILQDHTDGVFRCALSADGRVAFTVAGDDPALRVWDSDSGQSLRVLEGRGWVVSADGRVACSVDPDAHTFLQWDTATGQCLRTLRLSPNWAGCHALSADGRLALCKGEGVRHKVYFGLDEFREDHLLLWDLTSGQPPHVLEGADSYVLACAFSRDGRLALIATQDTVGKLSNAPKFLRLWDTTTGQTLQIFKGHSKEVSDCALSADGRLALSSSKGDYSLRLWDTTSGRMVRVFANPKGSAGHCALSADGRLALDDSFDHALRLWDTATGELLRVFAGHTSWITRCVLSADGRVALSASQDGTVRVWDTATASKASPIPRGHRGEIGDCALSADGHFALTRGAGRIWLWDTAAGQMVRGCDIDPSWLTPCALSADGRLALIASRKEIRLWDTATGQTVREYKERVNGVSYCALSADGHLAVIATGGTVQVWDTTTGRAIRVLWTRRKSVTSCALSADGHVCLAFSKGTLQVWDTATGRSLHVLKVKGQADKLGNCALSADGRVAFSSSQDKTLRLWDIVRGRCTHVFTAHQTRFSDWAHCALSADGRLALSASGDGTVRLWDTARGREIARWTHDGFPTVCALSATGDLAVVGDRIGGVHFLDVLHVVGMGSGATGPGANPPVSRLAEKEQSKLSILRRLFGGQ